MCYECANGASETATARKALKAADTVVKSRIKFTLGKRLKVPPRQYLSFKSHVEVKNQRPYVDTILTSDFLNYTVLC